VVAHQAVGKALPAVLRPDESEKLKQRNAVVVVEEDRLAAVAARGDV
jgi:hypothetical protein